MPPEPLPYQEVKRKLEAVGFKQAGQRGSHVKVVKHTSDGPRTGIVPRHRVIASGAIRSIPRQANLNPDDFERL